MFLIALSAASALIVATVLWSARLIASRIDSAREDARNARTLTILTAFAPALAAAHGDPRALLVWQPLARAGRTLFPAEFDALDRATGGTFPFSTERLQAAHAQWTADWLAWERAHDAEYKRKAADAQRELAAEPAPALRARLDAIEQQKLDLYQRRYQEYVQVARALQALLS